MGHIGVLDAARMVRLAYDAARDLDPIDRIDIRGAQAYLIKGDILVIPGTNERIDWGFNLHLAEQGKEIQGFKIVAGDSGRVWHAGFLRHAEFLYGFAKRARPKFIVGHSLGGASAQILGWSLRTPTVTFGSPRPLRGKAPLEGEGWILNLCRADDEVCHLPPRPMGFRHVGSVRWLLPEAFDAEFDHGMVNYIEILGETKTAERIEKQWPRAA
ncbi:alpha/beta hydrolase family protein [Roseitranquillus sediminis]|uniref:hypothetical protein n=1 Tax=Roseitranquillus sediminis TaxID=2809051 RepID=UPI001D0C3844|nr:hypothetical protein [Roseitranquillus sediminis]MBM9594256.1 hypothetical protein [Roseitranquillus sediminis]